METATPSAAQVVDLAKLSLPRLMFALLHRRFSGTLSLTQTAPEPGSRSVWFQGGMPIFTDWASPGDAIGQVLVDLELLAAGERDRAVAELSAPGAPRERFGHFLVRKRLVTGGQLRKALRTQCARKLVHLFALRSGSVRVQEGETVGGTEGDGASAPAQVNALEVIYAGVVTHYDVPRIASEMGLLMDGPLRLRGSLERYRAQFHFTPSDDAIVDALRPGGLFITDIARISGQSEARVAQVVYALWACQMLRSTTEPHKVEHTTGPVATLPESTGSSMPVLPRKSDSTGPQTPDFVADLERLEAAIAGGAHAFDLLGVPIGAERQQLRAAWHVLSRRFHPDGLLHIGLAHLRERSQAVFAALSEAYQRLSDPAQREQLVALLRTAPAPTTARPAAASTAQAVLESEVLIREGDKLLRAGGYDRALDRYRKAASKCPDDLELRAAIAWCEYRLAGDKPALRDATRAALFDVLARQPRSVRAHYDLGLLALSAGDDEQALKHFGDVLEIEPEMIDAKRQIHALHLRRSTPDKAKRPR